MIKKNTFLETLILTLASATSLTAQATGYEYSAETPCDIRVEPKAVEYTNAKFVYRADIGNEESSEGENKPDHLTADLIIDVVKKQKAERTCRDYIRKNFRTDILYDNGPILIAHHYHCAPPAADLKKVSYYNNYYVYYADVMYGDVVFERLTTEQILARKCEKLGACLMNSNGKDLDWISKKMGALGCQ